VNACFVHPKQASSRANEEEVLQLSLIALVVWDFIAIAFILSLTLTGLIIIEERLLKLTAMETEQPYFDIHMTCQANGKRNNQYDRFIPNRSTKC
jgi:hypothetical protein